MCLFWLREILVYGGAARLKRLSHGRENNGDLGISSSNKEI